MHAAFNKVRNWQILGAILVAVIIAQATLTPRPRFDYLLCTLDAWDARGVIEVQEAGTGRFIHLPVAARCRILVHDPMNTVFETEDGRCGVIYAVALMKDTPKNRDFIKQISRGNPGNLK